MRSERARFLDRRERRANDESSLFSALGENGRGFAATAPHLCGVPQRRERWFGNGVKNLSGSIDVPKSPKTYWEF